MSAAQPRSLHGPPCSALSSFSCGTTPGTSEVPAASAATGDTSSLATQWLTPLSALQSPYHTAASEASRVTITALAGLQRLEGNAFSLRHMSAPWSSCAAITTNGSATNATSCSRLTSFSEAGAAATSAATSASQSTPDTSSRAGWPSRNPPPATAMMIPRPVTASTPHARRDTGGRTRREKQAARPSQTGGVGDDLGMLMAWPPASLQLKGRSRSFSEHLHISRLPLYEEQSSDAQSGFEATYNAPLDTLVDTVAPISQRIQPVFYGVHNSDFRNSGGAPKTALQLHPSEARGVLPPTPQPRDGDGDSAWVSAGQQLPPALAPRGETNVSARLPSGLSSLPLPLSSKALMPPHHRSLRAAAGHAPTYVAVDGSLVNAQLSLPTRADALCSLFQQYMDAQRALRPSVRQRLDGASGQLTVPLDLQELVLRQVQDFALQLDAAAHPRVPPYQQALVTSLDQTPGEAAGTGRPYQGMRCPPLLLVPAAYKGDEVPWGAIFDYLAGPPTAAHATLRAVAPASRRRLEQLGWRWMIAKVAMSVCPFIQANGAEGNVRDAYVHLDGQERQYVGRVPVARRTPLPVVYQSSLATSEGLLDGRALLDYERQSLLLDWAWREGWLHRLACSHHAFLLPRLSDRCAMPSRICVDGVDCDVLRPKRNRLEAGGVGDKGGSGVAFTTSQGAEGIGIRTFYGTQLTPPPPSMLEKRPTEALSATRKLLDDAVGAISREWARSAGASRSGQLHSKLASSSRSYHAITRSSAVTAAVSSSFTSPSLETGRVCSLNPVTDLQHHLHYGHASLPVLVEDASGTAHLLCTSNTRLDTAEVKGWISAWLQHRHRLPRQPIRTSAAKFLSVGLPSASLRTVGEEVSEVDYVVCTPTSAAGPSPQVGLGRAWHPDDSRPGEEDGAARSRLLFSAAVTSPKGDEGEEGHRAAMPELVFTKDGLRDRAHMASAERLVCDVAVDEAGHAGHGAVAEDRFHMLLPKWRHKRRGMVRSMNNVDRPWPKLGSASGQQPRPLALHLTEQHIPWLAHQLCPDSEGGGLVDLQELHLCVTESLLPPGWAAAWRWCMSVLRDRKNLLVLSLATRPCASLMAEGVASDMHIDGKPYDTTEVIGGLSAFTATATMLAAPLQVLSLQGALADAVAPLFGDVSRGAQTEAGGDGAPPSLERLRELYVCVRSDQSDGSGLRSGGLGDVYVTTAVYPLLQVLWLDTPRLRRIYFDHSLVLRELHLISDAPLACSALRGVELLPHLEVVHLEKAVIDDCSFFGKCPALRELLLHACRLSPLLLSSSLALGPDSGNGGFEGLDGVEKAPRLETLSLCYTEGVRNLQNFARCCSLRRIFLTRCNGISSSSVAGIELLPHLELLAMEYTRVTSLSHFAATPALRVLRVDGCKRVLRSSVMGLETAALLTELSLQNTNVSTVANLGGGCRALRSLDLSGCRYLDADGLQGIQALPQLEVLSLSHTPVTDVNFLADCVRLTALYLEGCTELLPSSLEGLQGAPRLRKIVANGCPTLTRVGHLGKCAALEVLAVAGATALTAEGLQGIEQGRHIQYLDLSFTAVHTVHFLTGGCRALSYLSVKACQRITSLCALYGLEKLPRLQALNMESLDVHGRLDFLATSTSLRYVSYAGCTKLSSDDVQALRRSGVHTAIP